LKAWWDQPDQFDWIVRFLRQRGLLRAARVLMAVLCFSPVLAPLAVMSQPQNLTAHSLLVSISGGAFSAAATWFWLTHWPTRRQSRFLAVVGTLCLALWSVGQDAPMLGAVAATALAITGGYIAFFHSNRLLAFSFAVTGVVASTVAWQLAGQESPATVVAVFWQICFLGIAAPVVIRSIASAMGQYATHSEKDPLTGLLNRRGFLDQISGHLFKPDPSHTHLMVMMVDLDDFKRINDTHGHAVGDSVLRAVADLLRDHTPADGAICRAGGEEFLIAMTAARDRPPSVAPALCRAIGNLPHSVTASVGTATIELHHLAEPHRADLVGRLIDSADAAMYVAKRNGGNQVHHA
jgi:diguanylate cyclase (GGDEF)-like protein